MYPSFTPPANIPGDPAKLTPGQATRFLEWFKSVISRRIEVLAAEVRKTTEGENWVADFSPHSLRVLGTWLLANLSAIPEEVRILPAGRQSPKVVGGTHRLTEETLARCFDIGVYLGEILIRGNPKLSWDIEKAASKRNPTMVSL